MRSNDILGTVEWKKGGRYVDPEIGRGESGVCIGGSGLVPEGAEVVCVLTGNGLKDPDTAISESAPPITIPAERAALERIVLGDTA
jgi:threonine synthase